MSRIIHIQINDSEAPPATPEMEQERRVAIFDLIEDNSFAVPGRDGLAAPAVLSGLSLCVGGPAKQAPASCRTAGRISPEERQDEGGCKSARPVKDAGMDGMHERRAAFH